MRRIERQSRTGLIVGVCISLLFAVGPAAMGAKDPNKARWKEAKKDKKAEEKKGMFDKELMVKLENLGRKMGADPSSWRTEIPSAYSFSRD